MKISKFLVFMMPVFFLVACLAAEPAADDGMKTLRLISVDSEAKIALYVPTRAVISGPGNATAPIQMEIGQDRMIQGMISLQENPEELEKLSQRISQQYGPEMTVKKELMTSVAMKLSIGEQSLWEYQISSGNQGMPFQAMLPVNATSSLKISMHFTPAGLQQKSSRIESISQTRIITMSNNEASGSENLIASFSALENKIASGEFEIEQLIEF